MAHKQRRTAFNPLILGAVAVIAALVAFLVLREGTDMTQQARIDPPAATSPAKAPNAGPPGPANSPPATPDSSAK